MVPLDSAPGWTTPGHEAYKGNWEFITAQMRCFDFNGKDVADIGCRDGLFTFLAEDLGAARVLGCDNDLNPGTPEVVKLRNSQASFIKMNLYQMGVMAQFYERFDMVLFFGVLYHLRYPVWGLNCVLSTLKIGGTMLLETALFTVPMDYEVIYVPVKNSPYDATSCAFFNQKALQVTLESLGCEIKSIVQQPHGANSTTARFFVTVYKARKMDEAFAAYWEGKHTFHSEQNVDFRTIAKS